MGVPQGRRLHGSKSYAAKEISAASNRKSLHLPSNHYIRREFFFVKNYAIDRNLLIRSSIGGWVENKPVSARDLKGLDIYK